MLTGALSHEQRLLQDSDAVRYVWARIKARGVHRLNWTGPRDRKGYARVRWGGQEYQAHRVVWTALVGPIPEDEESDWTIDHQCPTDRDTACCTPEHERLLPRGKNTRERWEREQQGAPVEFAIALFAGVDRTAVQQKTVSLDELRRMLSKFEVLAHKRRGRCWSPTRYADGATTRANEGVASLVFACDKVPPDPKRLASVYWLGHTTWSHTALAPHWRVVIALTAPVSAQQWVDVWQRQGGALPRGRPVL